MDIFAFLRLLNYAWTQFVLKNCLWLDPNQNFGERKKEVGRVQSVCMILIGARTPMAVVREGKRERER